MIRVTIATENFRFLYTINEVLSKIKEIKTIHLLPNELDLEKSDVVITTEIERKHIQSSKIFVPKAFNHYYLFSNIFLIANNMKQFDKIVLGIDPGKTIGFAVIAQSKIVLCVNEFFTAVDVVKEVISVFFNVEASSFKINVGHGGGEIKDEILTRLEKIFHGKIPINVVNESFSSQNRNRLGQTKDSKNINAALNIASREI